MNIDIRGVDHLRTQSWLNGHVAGLEEVATWLLDQACVLFRAGKDGEATALRRLVQDMVTQLKPKMEARLDEHREAYPAELGG